MWIRFKKKKTHHPVPVRICNNFFFFNSSLKIEEILDFGRELAVYYHHYLYLRVSPDALAIFMAFAINKSVPSDSRLVNFH